MTVPPMIWSTRYLIDSTPRNEPSTAPDAMPHASPTHVLPAALAVMAATNAAVSSMPSMAMLTTPDRSHSRPARAPSAIGVARNRVPSSRPIKLVSAPRAAQVNSAMANSPRPRPNTA